jgi:hypothetical protein
MVHFILYMTPGVLCAILPRMIWWLRSLLRVSRRIWANSTYEQGLYKGADTLSLLKEHLVWLKRSTSEQLARLNIFGTAEKGAR